MRKLFSYVALSLMPLAFAWLFYHVYAQASLFDVVPYPHFDPFDYFLQINGIAAHGLGLGHYSQNEVVPVISSSPFGVHGPAYVILMGLLTSSFGGLAVTSAPVFNFTLLTAAMLIFIFLVRPGYGVALYATALILTYPEMIHYAATFWQESANIMLALVLASLFYKVLTEPDGSCWWRRILFLALMTGALIRPTWGFFLPGYFVATSDCKPWSVVRGLALGVLCLVVAFASYQLFASPWIGHLAPWQHFLLDLRERETSEALLRFVLEIYGKLVGVWASASKNHFLLLAIFFAPVSVALTAYKAFFGGKSGDRRFQVKLFWILAGYLSVVCATSLSQFLQSRHLYPGLLFCCLLLGSFRLLPGVRVLLLGAQVAALLLSFQLLQNYAYDLTRDIPGRLSRIDWFEKYSRSFLRVEPPVNAWCNSLLVPDFVTATEFLGLQKGFGVSYILAPKLYSGKIKSRYVIMKTDDQVRSFSASNNLRRLSGTTLGDLYVNLDCACPERMEPVALRQQEAARLERDVLDMPVREGVAWRDLLKSPVVEGVSVKSDRLSADEIMVTALFELDRGRFFEEQFRGKPTSGDDLAAALSTFDRLTIEVVFSAAGDGLRFVTCSLRVHCVTGRFNNYMLTDEDLSSLRLGRAISSIFWTHNDSSMPICQEP